MKDKIPAGPAVHQEEIAQMRRLQDSLVQMIVHDFRNPLASAMGYIELMECSLKEGRYGECGDYLKFMESMLNRLNSMISDLLDLGRMEESGLPMDFGTVSMSEVVEENLVENGIRLEDKGIRAVVTGQNSGALAAADRKLISRVVGNILSNAIRYSPLNGVIEFDIRVDGGDVELAVSNQGPKLPEHALERIFEKFYQVRDGDKCMGSGTGLGLAFCRMVMEAHSGSIRAVNNDGPGCSFIIRLPKRHA